MIKKLIISYAALLCLLLPYATIIARDCRPECEEIDYCCSTRSKCECVTPCCDYDDECCNCGCWGFTFKNGFFYPQDSLLRNIFNRCGRKGGYWVEGAMRYNFWRGLNVEVSGSYFKHRGIALCGDDCCRIRCSSKSCTSCCSSSAYTTTTSTSSTACQCGCECTQVKLPTVGVGLKYFFDCCDCWSFFVGGGLRVFFYKERNYSPYVADVKKNQVGAMVTAGVEFDLCHCVFLDIFVDYNYAKIKPCDKDRCSTDKCCATSSCSTSSTTSGSCCGQSYVSYKKTSSTDPCGECCTQTCCDLKIGGVVIGAGLGLKF